MPVSPLARLRKLCMSLSDVQEKVAWGEPTWRAGGGGGKLFAMFASPNSHHTHGRPAVWIKCTMTNQEFILRDNPRRYFKPPYVGTVGWIGAYLDKVANWAELAMLVQDAFELAAPRAAKRSPSKPATKRGAGATRVAVKRARKQHG